MRKAILIAAISTFFLACNDEIKVNEGKLDKLDSAGKDLQKEVKKGVDTVVSKIKKIKVNVEVKK